MFVKSILSTAIIMAAATSILSTTASADAGRGTFCKQVFFSGADRSTTKRLAYKQAVKKWKQQAQQTYGLNYYTWYHARSKKISCHDSAGLTRIGRRSKPHSGQPASKNWACTVEARPCKILTN